MQLIVVDNKDEQVVHQLERCLLLDVKDVLGKYLNKMFDERQTVIYVVSVSGRLDGILQFQAIDEIHLYLERLRRQENIVDKSLKRISRLFVRLIHQFLNVIGETLLLRETAYIEQARKDIERHLIHVDLEPLLLLWDSGLFKNRILASHVRIQGLFICHVISVVVAIVKDLIFLELLEEQFLRVFGILDLPEVYIDLIYKRLCHLNFLLQLAVHLDVICFYQLF